MRFFKYLVFLVLSIISINAFADQYFMVGYESKLFDTPISACKSKFPTTLSVNTPPVGGLAYCKSPTGGDFASISAVASSCPSSVSSNPISVPNWDKWTLDQSDAYYSKNVTGKTACYQGCRYKDPSMGGTPPELHLTYGSPVKDSSCPPDGTTKPSTPVPDGTPPQPPTQCKNAQGSDAYCDKPPTGCPSGYKSGSFNNKEICVKNSPDPDPTKPNPNDPNNGDGKGSCNGTNNCNTTNLDDSKIISAIDSLKSSFNSAISTMTNTLSSAISSVTSAVNAVTSSINSNTAAVNASAEKVKSAVDSNTAATNSVKTSVDANTAATNSVKSSVDANTAATNSVKTSVDANTAAVNANGDKIKGAVDANTAATNSVKTSVDANTAAVNANGDKVKTAVDANTTAVNANGDKIKGAVDANTEAVKEGNTLLDDIKKWLSDSEGVSSDDGLITVDKFEFQNQPDKFNWSAQCPAPIEKNTTIIGYSWTYSFSFDNWCAVLAKLSNYFVFAATFGACLIIAGVRNG